MIRKVAGIVRARDIDTYLRTLATADDPNEGVLYGDPDTVVGGILCAWKATTDAIDRAARLGCNVLLVHETLFDPSGESFWSPPTAPMEGPLSWKGNVERVKRLAKRDVVVVRSHATADLVCVQEACMTALGMTPQIVGELGFPLMIADVPATTLAELAVRAKKAVGLAHIRVAGRPKLKVTRVGNGWGGLSLARHVDFLEALRAHGCQAIIAGEAEEYACQYVQDCGCGLIELGHAASEDLGIKRLARIVARRFTGLKVRFYAIRSAFTWM